MLHASILGASLAVFWLLLSGYFTVPLLLTLGAFSAALTVYPALRMDDGERVRLHLDPKMLRYWTWLLVQIVKANIDVAKLILSPKLTLSLRMIWVPAPQKTDTAVVI